VPHHTSKGSRGGVRIKAGAKGPSTFSDKIGNAYVPEGAFVKRHSERVKAKKAAVAA